MSNILWFLKRSMFYKAKGNSYSKIDNRIYLLLFSHFGFWHIIENLWPYIKSNLEGSITYPNPIFFLISQSWYITNYLWPKKSLVREIIKENDFLMLHNFDSILSGVALWTSIITTTKAFLCSPLNKTLMHLGYVKHSLNFGVRVQTLE